MEKKIYTLSKVAQAIENIINTHAAKRIWVKAEIVKLNYYKHSGHCYPDLVEKKNGKIVAEMRGNIWNRNYERINANFKAVLNEGLKDNMTVVCLASVQFHPVYGLSLNISEIDPNYTLGELARHKAETIARLKKEQLFDQNKQKLLPVLPKTIAVISVETSKGYQDFTNVIENNPWGYRFHIRLFPAILQGTQAVATIGRQLQIIEKQLDVFDAVAIIRGGGGDIGLSSFDEYALARVVACYPIPVLSGIGHSTNETITEMVSWQSFITPTKIAEFLIQQFHNFSIRVDTIADSLIKYSNEMISRQGSLILESARLFSSLSQNYIQQQEHGLSYTASVLMHHTEVLTSEGKSRIKQMLAGIQAQAGKRLSGQMLHLDQLKQLLGIHSMQIVQNQKISLGNFDNNIKILSPERILERGFSITRINGKTVKSIQSAREGDEMDTRISDGYIKSKITKIK